MCFSRLKINILKKNRNIALLLIKTKNMKNFLLLFVVALTLVACNKCQDCTCDNVTEEICKDDFDSNDDYNQAIAALELLGCDCK